MNDLASPVSNNRLQRLTLRIHGTALLVLTPIFLVIITIGYRTGTGMYGAMREQPLGYAGFWQAYTLMFVIGIALWVGSYSDRPRRFDAVGAAAHIPILFALIAFSETWSTSTTNLYFYSVPIHVTAILAETIAFFWPDRKRSGAKN